MDVSLLDRVVTWLANLVTLSTLRNLSPKGRRIVGVGGGTLLVIFFALGVFIGRLTADGRDPGNRTKSASVTITRPDGDAADPVPLELVVEGEVTGLRQGHALWAVHNLVGTTQFVVASGPCVVADDDNRFSCPKMFVGKPEDASKAFQIILWEADGDAQKWLIDRLRETDFENPLEVTNQPQGVERAASLTKVRA